ncbi:MAG: hypothetical protein HY779_00330 [Rubrobacteridae bacterium]|nr:hypothetical protein [Rubrobacteridae bacterium]
MENRRESVVLTFILSMVPGVGHFYLGLMNRGLQLMVTFVGSIVIGSFLDIPELAAFIPVIWFYTLFDALQMTEAINSGKTVEDKPIYPLSRKIMKERTIGWIFIGVGVLLILKKILPGLLGVLYLNPNIQTAIVAFVLIAIGIRILKPGKNITSKNDELGDGKLETRSNISDGGAANE